MKRQSPALIVCGLLVLLPLWAQAQEGPRAAALRRELEVRFAQQIREQLQLTDEQSGKVRDIMSTYAERRRELEQQERAMRMGLNGQLRPGIAAQPDSVTRLIDGISAGRVAYARLFQDEMKELSGVLDPVQRGQLFLMRDRLLARVQEMREQSRLRGGGPPGPPR